MAETTEERILESGRSLEGTLPSRSLPQDEGGLASFKDALRQVALTARAQTRPTVGEELGRFEQAGVKLTTPGTISAGLQAGTLGRREVERSTFAGIKDLLQQQEDKLAQERQANLQFSNHFLGMITSNPSLLASMTGEDFESLKSGVVSTELIQKISEAAAQPEADEFQFVPGGSVEGGGVFNKATGVFEPVARQGDTGSVSYRHNNPLNIKFGDFAQGFGATQGQAATDGGTFALFPDEETGLQAAKQLLTGPSYANLPLEQAMRRWSGGGYGADVAPALAGKTISQMDDQELGLLVDSMRQREGWRAPVTIPESASNLSARTQAVYDNPALLENFTPTEKGKILDEIAGAGLPLDDFTLQKLNAGQRENLDLLDTVLREAENAQFKLDEGINTGPFISRVKRTGALLGFADNFTDYRSIIDNMGSILVKARSGAAVTPQEFERIAGFIPSINEDEDTAKIKIIRFKEEMTRARENYAVRSTQTSKQILDSVLPQSSDGADDPLGIF